MQTEDNKCLISRKALEKTISPAGHFYGGASLDYPMVFGNCQKDLHFDMVSPVNDLPEHACFFLIGS